MIIYTFINLILISNISFNTITTIKYLIIIYIIIHINLTIFIHLYKCNQHLVLNYLLKMNYKCHLNI